MTQTVLMTGASSGLRKAAAGLSASNGWNVVATMRHPAAGRALGARRNVLVTRLDVRDPASIDEAIEAGISAFGRTDVVINNAGFGLFGVFEATPREKVREQFEVNVSGAMDVTRALLPHFRSNRAGVIVNVSSGAGVFTLPMISLYCASKFALEGFSEALTYELSPLGIAVKIVEPGGVATTNFARRSGDEAGQIAAPPDYDDFVAATDVIFAGVRDEAPATEGDVAKVIYQAATDGSDRLRYVATTDILPLVQARRETSEQRYIALLRSRFMASTRAR